MGTKVWAGKSGPSEVSEGERIQLRDSCRVFRFLPVLSRGQPGRHPVPRFQKRSTALPAPHVSRPPSSPANSPLSLSPVSQLPSYRSALHRPRPRNRLVVPASTAVLPPPSAVVALFTLFTGQGVCRSRTDTSTGTPCFVLVVLSLHSQPQLYPLSFPLLHVFCVLLALTLPASPTAPLILIHSNFCARFDHIASSAQRYSPDLPRHEPS